MTESNHNLALRKKAVEKINNKPINFDELDKKTVETLYHELQVHQVELEIQNEELRNIQSTMEANKLRYISLFDNAPVGYVILDSSGIIKQFNKTFYGIVRDNEVMKRTYVAFADLLDEKSAHIFRSRFASFLSSPNKNSSIEAEIPGGNGGMYAVIIKLSSHMKLKYNSKILPEELLVTITDITEQKKIKTELEQALDRISKLSGLVPICSQCKKIRDDKGFWNSLEGFIEEFSVTEFTHSLCPECSDALYGSEGWYNKMKKKKEKN